MALKTTTISLTITGGEEKSLGSGSTKASFPAVNPLYLHQNTLSNGTGSANAQKVGLASFSLSGGASVTLDLTAFTGPYGNVNFSLIKECVVDNESSRVGDILEIGNDGTVTDPWISMFSGASARAHVDPGAAFKNSSPLVGFAVGGSNKNLLIKNTNSGTNILSGNVLLIGEGT